MTHEQRRALAFIRAFIATNDGVSPTFAEIGAHLGLASKAGVARLVNALEERGLIRREGKRGAARSIVPVEGTSTEYERGYAAGYRAAVKKFGHRALTPSPSAETPSTLRAIPPRRDDCRPVEQRSRSALSSSEAYR